MNDDAKLLKLKDAVRRGDRRDVANEILKQALAAYDAGRYVDAFQIASQAGGTQGWRGGAAQTFGCRLARNCGGGRLSTLLMTRAMREAPEDAEVTVHACYHLRDRRGPMVAWEHALRAESLPGMRPGHLADLRAERAEIAAGYRDFETAWQLWELAYQTSANAEADGGGGEAWLQVVRAGILVRQERKEEALAALEKALAARAWFRPAVQLRARVLHLLNRFEEAIGHLSEALEHLQSYSVAAQLLTLKREVDDHSGMAELADRTEALAPLLGAAERYWLTARRVDILYLKGDHEGAAALAVKIPVSAGYYTSFAERLRRAGGTCRRVRLPFEFVHQKHNTCAPATLAALAHFWRRPIAMEQITEAICYDGTYDYSERQWAIENGFATREFTVTLAAVRQLIDAGVPFEVSTVDVGSAHAQAVIGYDDLRESLFIQDPSEPHYREVESEEFLNGYRLNGPRGLVLAPVERREWLESLDLPDAALYDLSHRFNLALNTYDRPVAAAAVEELETAAAGHRLTLLARLSLAAFDGDDLARAAGVEALLKVLPEDPRLLHWKYQLLREEGRRQDRLALLREAGLGKTGNPVFLKDLCAELMADARDWPEARRRLARLHEMLPADPVVLVQQADLAWRSRRQAGLDLLTYHRFAAASADKVEGYARLWFSFACAQGKAEEALGWLRRRFEAYGALSGAPALTLVHALDTLGRAEVLAVAREAAATRPEDGDLLLQLAGLEARLGRLDEADDLLQRAKGKSSPRSWARARAAQLRRRGDYTAEQEVWRGIAASEPLALDAHGAVARHIAAAEGTRAGATYLRQVSDRFPHHYGLAQSTVGWLREAAPEEALEKLRQMQEMHPDDPWVLRELAIVLREMNRTIEAQEPAEAAAKVAPDQPASHAVLGFVLSAQARDAEAEPSFQRALELDVNHAPAIEGLLGTARDSAGRRTGLAFVRREMIRQVLDGNGLHAYRGFAFGILEPKELLAELREIWEARPDLWEAWSVLASQMMDSGQPEDALKLAREAVERFPLLPGAWGDLATILRLTESAKEAAEAARRAVELNPDWADGWQKYAEFLDDTGRTKEAISALRDAMARLPLNHALASQLASLLWRIGAREEAWKLAAQVARAEPGQDWVWNVLQTWSEMMGRDEDLAALAREIAAAQPGSARAHFVVAAVLPAQDVAEALAALERAIQLNPRYAAAYDLRAEILARVDRVVDAEQSLRGGPWTQSEMPANLQGRLAWLIAKRGDIPEAARQMRRVVGAHTDYHWGWVMLAEWAEQRQDLPGWREAAAALIRLNPRSPGAYCTAADAELAGRDFGQAVELLRRALHIDPANPGAAHRLLAIHWSRNDLDGLEQDASALPDQDSAGLVRRVYLMLAAGARNDRQRLGADLQTLAQHPDLLGSLPNVISEAFATPLKKFERLYAQVLDTAARDGTIGPSFAQLWVRRQAREKRWQCWIMLASWLPRLGAKLDAALFEYLDKIGEARAADPHVVQLTLKHGGHLRERGVIWGQIGYALAASGAFRPCVDWLLPDYQRADANGWMLANLVISLRRIGESMRARDVSLHAVRQGMRDDTWNMHVTVAAHALAEQGRYQEAMELLERESPAPESPEIRLLLATAKALCQVMPMAAGSGQREVDVYLAGAKDIMRVSAVGDPAVSDYRAAAERLIRHSGLRRKPYTPPRNPTASGNDRRAGVGLVIVAVTFIFGSLISNFERKPDPRGGRDVELIRDYTGWRERDKIQREREELILRLQGLQFDVAPAPVIPVGRDVPAQRATDAVPVIPTDGEASGKRAAPPVTPTLPLDSRLERSGVMPGSFPTIPQLPAPTLSPTIPPPMLPPTRRSSTSEDLFRR